MRFVIVHTIKFSKTLFIKKALEQHAWLSHGELRLYTARFLQARIYTKEYLNDII